MQKIKYLKHPVSPEQKAKLNAQGFKILDEKFKPKAAAKPKAKAVKVDTDN